MFLSFFAFVIREQQRNEQTDAMIMLSCKTRGCRISLQRSLGSASWQGLQTICLNGFGWWIWIVFVLLFAYFRSVLFGFFFFCFPTSVLPETVRSWLQDSFRFIVICNCLHTPSRMYPLLVINVHITDSDPWFKVRLFVRLFVRVCGFVCKHAHTHYKRTCLCGRCVGKSRCGEKEEKRCGEQTSFLRI